MGKPQVLCEVRETQTQITVSVKKPNLKYLNDFVRLKCSPDLLVAKLFPNAKEVTESMAAYSAVRNHLWNIFDPADRNVFCFVIGDGSVPRTGATFAFRTRWNVISVDPNLYNRTLDFGHSITEPKGIRGLTAMRTRVENMTYDFPAEKVLIVCVHSHAKLSECCKAFKNYEKYIVNIPCCVKPDLDIEPDVCYTDWGIHSEKREVEIYKELIS